MSTATETSQLPTDQISAVADNLPPAEPVWDECQPAETIKVRNSRGVVEEYEIREMKGPELSTWMAIWSKYSARVIGEEAKTAKPEENGQAEPTPNVYLELISRCLYKGDNRVPRAIIERWGGSLLSHLFSRCQSKNGQTAKAEAVQGKS